MTTATLAVEDLSVVYETDQSELTAVSKASFEIDESEFFGLVGESGCGKSTLAEALVGGLDTNGRIAGGTITYEGEIIYGPDVNKLDEVRWNEIAYIPQNAMNSLDPLQRISDQAAVIGQTHSEMDRATIDDRLKELFRVVGINEDRIHDYPHQFSGGMAQRVIIAFALLLDPSLLISDEPTTALDVIMQDQVFKYFDNVKEQMETSMMLITHDISVVFESCERMAVMHGGQIDEIGTTQDVFHAPRHPYSILLQESFPQLDEPGKELKTIEGTPPELLEKSADEMCTFADRCPMATEECRLSRPPLEPLDDRDDGSSLVACFHKDESAEFFGGAE